MRRTVLITVIKSATWLQLLLLVVHLKCASTLPQGPSTDPCEASPCGNGAECKSMGSIAICVCPNNGKGDPFVACMQGADEAELVKPSPSASPVSSTSSDPILLNKLSTGHQARASPTATTTSKPTSKPPSTTTTRRVSLITSSTTIPPSTQTTTRSPYVHVFQTTSERPSGGSSGFGYSHNNRQNSNSHSHGDDSIPESHRIPIISNNGNNNNNNAYPQHEYPPRPLNGDSLSTSTPSHYSTYHNGGGPIAGSSSYDIFNEKTVGPIAGSDYGITSSYPYRGSNSGHYSGTQSIYEYDSRPILGPSRPTPTMGYHQMNRFGHHGYHPSSSGFPDPITEPSSARYPSSPGTGTAYDIYNYNPVRNDIVGSSSDGGYSRIADPLGKYENCRMVNGIVVCADNVNTFPYNHHQYRHHHEGPHLRNHHRGEIMTTTSNYGSHYDRDRDHYSPYYTNRYSSVSPSMTSDRPHFDYDYVNRQGYPQHGPRHPIDSSTTYGHHSFLPKEQKISTQSILTISPSSSVTTGRNDNDNPLCRSMCGINSVCRLVLDRPVCGCAEGHTGDPSVRCNPTASVYSERSQRREADSCERHVECKETEICAKNKCIDPCKHQDQILGGSSSVKIDTQFKTSICGTNAECLVVGHTPVCKCTEGYSGNPYVSCVP